MSSVTIDHVTLGLSRIAAQYLDSQKFLAYIKSLLMFSPELESLLQKIAEQADIDLAEGVNLDVIGEIVGISRYIPNSLALPYFGFEDGGDSANPYGDSALPGIGARFFEEGSDYLVTTVLSDPEYRSLIRAKITRNHSRGTPEDVLKALSFIFNSASSIAEDEGGMAVGLYPGAHPTLVQQVLVEQLDILPRPAGVRFKLKGWFDSTRFFGFEGMSGALSFGEEGDVTIGGFFLEEYQP